MGWWDKRLPKNGPKPTPRPKKRNRMSTGNPFADAKRRHEANENAAVETLRQRLRTEKNFKAWRRGSRAKGDFPGQFEQDI